MKFIVDAGQLQILIAAVSEWVRIFLSGGGS
jgi:hypothetical protein